MLDAYEMHIANFFLSAFPQPISWEDLLDKIEREDDSVDIWEPFADFDRDNVICWMEESKSSLMGNFVQKDIEREIDRGGLLLFRHDDPNDRAFQPHTVLLVKPRKDKNFSYSFSSALDAAKAARPDEWNDSEVYGLLIKEGWEFSVLNIQGAETVES